MVFLGEVSQDFFSNVSIRMQYQLDRNHSLVQDREQITKVTSSLIIFPSSQGTGGGSLRCYRRFGAEYFLKIQFLPFMYFRYLLYSDLDHTRLEIEFR